MKIIVTGCAGFIGYHLCAALVRLRHDVVGIDNLNQYYDVQLKLSRLDQLKNFDRFSFIEMDILDKGDLKKCFHQHKDCEVLIHLAAQPGVRYSLKHPKTYVKNNILGTVFLYEVVHTELPNLKHLIAASSSSVYGNNKIVPFSVDAKIDKPLSVYAASKAACELFSHTYRHLYYIPISVVRFFTVYGPYGRPDMTPFLFTKAMMENKPITLYQDGNLKRDFTYIDDIINGLVGLINKGYDEKLNLFNLGNTKPIKMRDFVSQLEVLLDREAIIESIERPRTEPKETYADITTSKAHFNYAPKINLKEGLETFVKWYKAYYHNL